MCQHLVHYNIYYLGLHDYMLRVVCWSFSPSLPSLEARNDTKPSHESSLVRAGGSKPAIQLLYHFLKTCYPPTFTMLLTIIFGQRYFRTSHRAQQEQSCNTEEQVTSKAGINTSITQKNLS